MNDTAVLAVAGAAKTQLIVDEVAKVGGHRTLVTTYTNGNTEEVRGRIAQKLGGGLPPSCHVMPWQTFLYRHGVLPYQAMWSGVPNQICGVFHAKKPDPALRFVKKSEPLFFLTSGQFVRGERLGHLVAQIAEASSMAWVRRLERMYDSVYIDEFQDIAGYDLDVVESLFQSSLRIVIVGDPHQLTFKTTRERRNKKFLGKTGKWLAEKKIGCEVEHRNRSFRCGKSICEFANVVVEGLNMQAGMEAESAHGGVFVLTEAQLDDYLSVLSPLRPQGLRWDKRKVVDARVPIMNMGASKGRTFEHVLIYPTGPMEKFLKDGKQSHLKDESRAKLYISATRAKHSVAFVTSSRPRDLIPSVARWEK